MPEAVIVSAARTAVGKAGRGSLKTVRPDDLAATAIRAAVVVMSANKARALGLQPLACSVSFAVAGVPPEVMGIGPAVAVPKAFKAARITLDQVESMLSEMRRRGARYGMVTMCIGGGMGAARIFERGMRD